MELRSRLPAIVQGAALVLFFAAFITIQALVGGTRLIFSLLAYVIAGVGGILLLLLLRRSRPAPCRACLVVTAIAFAYLLTRAIISPAPFIAQSDIYSMLAGLVVYLAFSLLLTSNPARMLFLAGLFLFALLHVFVGALQFREGNNFMPISWLQRADYGARASGFYVCPNHLAGLLEVLGVFALSIACWSRWPGWARLLSGYAAACCYVGLIVTGSRGGYVSTAASFLAFGILSLVALRNTNSRIFWRAAGLGLIGAIIFAVLVTFGVTQSRFLSERAGNVVDKTNVRRELWHAALQQWKLAPVLGTGSATYLYYGRYFRTPGMDRDPVYVHNDYLQLLAEYGLAGALAMGALIVVHARRGLRSFARLGPKRVAISHQLFSNGLALNVGALASLSAYAVHEALDFNLHIPANALLLAFVFAILANDGVIRDRDVLPVTRGDVFWRVLLGALALLLVAQSGRLLPGAYYSELARAAVRDNKPTVAILQVTRGLHYAADNPELFDELGQAWSQLGDASENETAAQSFYAEAADAFEKARAIAPQDETYALDLASTLDEARRFSEAEWNFYDALQLDPQSESLRRYYDNHLTLWERPTKSEGGAEAARIW